MKFYPSETTFAGAVKPARKRREDYFLNLEKKATRRKYRLAWTLVPLFGLLLSSCRDRDISQSAEELIPAGWESYRLGEFDRAVEQFQKAAQVASKEDQNLSMQGIFGEAACWQYRRDGKDTSRAAALYNEIIQVAPRRPLAPWSKLAKVRIQHFGRIEPKPDYESLAREYAAIYERYPDHPAGQEAFVNRFHILLFDPSPDLVRHSLPELKKFLARHPESPFLSPVCAQISLCYKVLKERDESLSWLIRAFEKREKDQGNPNADNSGSYWSIGRAAEYEAGNFTVARSYYQRLIDEYPKDQRIYEVRRALRRMGEVEDIVRRGGDLSPDGGEAGS